MNASETNIAAFIDMDFTLYKKYLWQARLPLAAGR